MDQIAPIVIVGPTASGKTDLSLFLASSLPSLVSTDGVDILVVDSKQVYTGQDIVTGKDIPSTFSYSAAGLPHYQFAGTRLFGLNLVEPNVSWSLANFLSYASSIKQQSHADNRLLLIVGGTPLYTLALFRSPQTAMIEPNQELREELGILTVSQLQEQLSRISARRFTRMNPSDRQNPRRLVRAIETEVAKKLSDGWIPAHQAARAVFDPIFSISHSFWIGLSVEKPDLEARIGNRVTHRIEAGAIDEYTRLHTTYPDWKPEAKSALGYGEIARFLEEGLSQDLLEELWTKHEVQYAKRQMTWWKREKQIHWYDSSNLEKKDAVLAQLKDWYTQL
ncbi:hypothetical protein KBD71_01255 [Candidatus Woesebacteria bacterium]|nr:hypothetical protein [Candidatus Woesebacteria bacterium]